MPPDDLNKPAEAYRRRWLRALDSLDAMRRLERNRWRRTAILILLALLATFGLLLISLHRRAENRWTSRPSMSMMRE